MTSSYLVTGGAGFIGGHMAEYLRRERPDAAVRVIDNLATGRRSTLELLAAQGVETIEGDLLDPAALARAVAGVDTIFHLAAIPSVPRSVEAPLECDLANVHATVALLEAARARSSNGAGVRRIVYAASSSAYGDQQAAVKTEDLLPEPLSPYAVSKLAGEHYLRAFHTCHGLETVALRYFNVFGPRQDPQSLYAAVIPRFITRMLAGEAPTIFGDGTQTRDFTFVENNCRANLMVAEAPAAAVAGRVFNVACGEAVSLLELVELLNDLLGTTIAPRFEPRRPGDVLHSLASVEAARAAFGYAPGVSLRTGLERTVAFYRASAAAVAAPLSTPPRA